MCKMGQPTEVSAWLSFSLTNRYLKESSDIEAEEVAIATVLFIRLIVIRAA